MQTIVVGSNGVEEIHNTEATEESIASPFNVIDDKAVDRFIVMFEGGDLRYMSPNDIAALAPVAETGPATDVVILRNAKDYNVMRSLFLATQIRMEKNKHLRGVILVYNDGVVATNGVQVTVMELPECLEGFVGRNLLMLGPVPEPNYIPGEETEQNNAYCYVPVVEAALPDNKRPQWGAFIENMKASVNRYVAVKVGQLRTIIESLPADADTVLMTHVQGAEGKAQALIMFPMNEGDVNGMSVLMGVPFGAETPAVVVGDAAFKRYTLL